MSQTPLHDWLRPRFDLLVTEAAHAGFEREATLAVLTDIISADAAGLVPPPTEPDLPHNNWPSPSEELGLYPETEAPELSHGQWPRMPSNDHGTEI